MNKQKKKRKLTKLLVIYLTTSFFIFLNPSYPQETFMPLKKSQQEDFRQTMYTKNYYRGDSIYSQSRTLYHYNSSGNLIEEQVQSKNNEGWYDSRITYYMYNDQSLLEETYYKGFSRFTQEWHMGIRDLNFYDSLNRIVCREYYNWPHYSNDWRYTSKWTYTYSTDGLNYILKHHPSHSLGMECHYFFDEASHLIEVIWYLSEGMITHERHLYNYNKKGDIIRFTYQRPDSIGWLNNAKYEYYYIKERLDKKKSFSWIDSTWKEGSQWNYQYDDLDNLAQVKHQIRKDNVLHNNYLRLYGYDHSFNLVELRSYDWNQDKWSLYQQDIWEWEQNEISGTKDMPNNLNYSPKVTMYPNPGWDKINFDIHLSQPEKVIINIYNQMGQTIWQHKTNLLMPGIHKLNWSNSNTGFSPVKTGLYIVKIQIGNTNYSNKLLINK